MNTKNTFWHSQHTAQNRADLLNGEFERLGLPNRYKVERKGDLCFVLVEISDAKAVS
jgi:hypothetical protein